eukprot:10331249-Prorocentrum_lima.AAC.1
MGDIYEMRNEAQGVLFDAEVCDDERSAQSALSRLEHAAKQNYAIALDLEGDLSPQGVDGGIRLMQMYTDYSDYCDTVFVLDLNKVPSLREGRNK